MGKSMALFCCGTIYGAVTAIDWYVPNNTAAKYVKQKLTVMQLKHNHNIMLQNRSLKKGVDLIRDK